MQSPGSLIFYLHLFIPSASVLRATADGQAQQLQR